MCMCIDYSILQTFCNGKFFGRPKFDILGAFIRPMMVLEKRPKLNKRPLPIKYLKSTFKKRLIHYIHPIVVISCCFCYRICGLYPEIVKSAVGSRFEKTNGSKPSKHQMNAGVGTGEC